MVGTEDKLIDARCLLIAAKPWYGHAAATMKWIVDASRKTMCVSVGRGGKVVCRYGPSFVAECSVLELAAVIEHEIEHVLRQHCVRGAGLDQRLFNVACDMVVNGHQESPRIGIVNPRTGCREIPREEQLCWLPFDWPTDVTAEQCYEKLIAEGHTTATYSDYLTLDEHDLWESTDIESARHAAACFARAAESAGVQTPKSVASFLDQLLEHKIRWQEVLRRFVCRSAANQKRINWGRRSRRVDRFGMPGKKPEGRIRLSIVVDTSGSVSEEVLSQFFSEMEALSHLATMNVLTWSDRRGLFLSPYQTGDWTKLRDVDRGGTDMVTPVDWLRENKELGDALLVLTDGYCEWPDRQTIPMLVVSSTPLDRISEPPWGDIIHLPT